MQNKTVVIFGVFDGVHGGHLSFINDAKKQGNHLIAIVARDKVVEELKGKLPKYNEVDRINFVLKVPEVDLVLLGDGEIGTYKVLREVKPDIVFLGYDQHSLENNLKKTIKDKNLNDMKIIKGVPYKPEIFHSSIMNNR